MTTENQTPATETTATNAAPAATPPAAADTSPATATADTVAAPAKEDQLLFPSKKDDAPIKDEAKPADVKPEDKKDGEKPADEKPIEYTDFALPEEFQIPPELKEEFTTIARENKIPQESAQKFIDMHIKQVNKYQEKFEEIKQDWRKETEALPFMQGKERDASIGSINDAVRKFSGDPETFEGVKDALVMFGLGNNPHMTKFLHNVALATKEDNIGGGAGSGGGKMAVEDVLFGPQRFNQQK
jgi:hypothetical protein